MKVFLDEGAILPTRAHETDAGLDLYSPKWGYIAPGRSEVIDTGVHVRLPKNTFGKLESKSGLNVNYGVVCCGGVIDEGYTGSIKVKMYNLSDQGYAFYVGDKIVQLIVQPCVYEPVEQVEEWSNDTARADRGFGSTGK